MDATYSGIKSPPSGSSTDSIFFFDFGGNMIFSQMRTSLVSTPPIFLPHFPTFSSPKQSQAEMWIAYTVSYLSVTLSLLIRGWMNETKQYFPLHVSTPLCKGNDQSTIRAMSRVGTAYITDNWCFSTVSTPKDWLQSYYRIPLSRQSMVGLLQVSFSWQAAGWSHFALHFHKFSILKLEPWKISSR